MSLLVDLVAISVALLVGAIIRRYLIMTSGEHKTNLPFIKRFNLITGSKDIIFTNDKTIGVNAEDRHKELGDIFGCYLGQNMHIVCRDLDLIYKVCVSDFQRHRNRMHFSSLSPYMQVSLLEARDDKWQTSRRAIGSVLKASKLKMDNVVTDIDSTVGRMIKSIDKRLEEAKAKSQDTIMDVHQINKNFFMQSILKIIYDSEELVDFEKNYNDAVEELHYFVNVNYEYIQRLCFLLPTLTYFVRPLIGFFDHGKYLGILTRKLEHILVKTLNKVKDNNQKDARPTTTIHSMINSYRKGELTKQQLMGNAVFLMVAGFATSIDSMSALLWELARNPKVQDKLRADLEQYGEESEYLEQCINETLRLYPGTITTRELGEHIYYKDFRLVKGSCLDPNIYSVHRDPRYWGQDAEVWRPERFDKSEVAKFHPAQFMPFGIGPRNCVGYNFAKLELIKFTVQFVIKYKVEPCAKTQSKIKVASVGAIPFALPLKGPFFLRVKPAMGN